MDSEDRASKNMEKLVTLGKEFGFEGKEFWAFVKEQQEEEKRRLDEERQERQRECETRKLEAEEREREYQRGMEVKEWERQLQAKEKEAERRHELEMKQLELESVNNGHGEVSNASTVAIAKLPKLTNFIDGKNNLDSYLQRFDQFAKSNK